MKTNLVLRAKGWTKEDNESNQELGGAYYKPVLEDPSQDLRWYASYLAGETHTNFLGKVDADKGGAFAVSLVREMKDFTPRLRGIIWTVSRKQHVLIDVKKHKDLKKSLVEVLKAGGAPDLAKAAKKMVMANSPHVRSELLKLEEFQTPTNYKIGVLFVRAGQTLEEEFFANDAPNPAAAADDDDDGDEPDECDSGVAQFNAFLDLLGTRVALNGWDGYKAGLDVENGGTGEESVFTSIRGCDVMFHVCTMLPHDTTGQEVQRKRQIGNDVTAIVFCERGASFNPGSIDSQFLHVYAVVTPGARDGTYDLAFLRQDSVRPFGPLLTTETFAANSAFVDFVLTKLINGERACLQSAPIFVHTYQRTVRSTLNNLYEGLKSEKSPDELAPAAGPARASGPIGVDAGGPRSAIAPMDVTDSIFEVAKMDADYDGDLLCLAEWSGMIVFSTTNGVFVSDGLRVTTRARISKYSMAVLRVREDIGVLVGSDAKKGTLRVWSLAKIRDATGLVKEAKLPNSKSTHVWDIAKPITATYLAAGKGKAILLFKWDASSAAFVHQHTYALPTRAKVLRFLGTSLVVAFAQEFDTLQLETSEVHELFVPTRNVNPLDVLFLGHRHGEPVSPLLEFVLCYDNKGVIVNLFGDVSRAFELRWTATPSAFAYIDPYVIAVTPKYIEVRTTLNGTLIQRVNLTPPIKLLSFSTSLYVLSGSGSGSGSSVFQVRPDLAANLIELDALSNALKDTVSSPSFKVTNRHMSGAIAATSAVRRISRAISVSTASHEVQAALDAAAADAHPDSELASSPASHDSSPDPAAHPSVLHGTSDPDIADEANHIRAMYLMHSTSSDDESETGGLGGTKVVPITAADNNNSNDDDGPAAAEAAASSSASTSTSTSTSISGVPDSVRAALIPLRAACESANASMDSAESAMVIDAVAAVEAAVAAVDPAAWPLLTLQDMFPGLMHLMAMCVSIEASAELQAQALAASTVHKVFAPLEDALNTVRTAVPQVGLTVGGVRTSLMAVRRFKQFVDTLVVFAADDVPATVVDSVRGLADGVAEAASALVVATKEFSELPSESARSAAVCTAAELLQAHSRHLFRATSLLTAHHDVEHIASFASPDTAGQALERPALAAAVVDFSRVVEAAVADHQSR